MLNPPQCTSLLETIRVSVDIRKVDLASFPQAFA